MQCISIPTGFKGQQYHSLEVVILKKHIRTTKNLRKVLVTIKENEKYTKRFSMD